MTRYIDVDKLTQKVNPWLDGGILVIALQSLNEAETADVVPRTIVNQIFEDIFLKSYYKDGTFVVSHSDIVRLRDKYKRELNL